jgi:hypothetical protein
MAGRQREISVSEFFLKNRHLLGFDTPSKAVVTAVKEAVDNALDACEEAGILPEITIEVRNGQGRSRIVVEETAPASWRARSHASSASSSTARNSTSCGNRAASTEWASRQQECTGS